MSFILDALRKSELERQRQSGPSIAELPVARESRGLPLALVAIGVLLAVNVAVLAYFLTRDDAPPAAAATGATVAAAPVAPLPAPPAPSAAPAQASGQAPAAESPAIEPLFDAAETEAPAARDPTLLPEAPPTAVANGATRYDPPAPPPVEALPPQAAASLAELSVDLHIYSTDPAKRAVFINGRRYTEGMVLAEGPTVEEINRDGVVINHRGQRFLLPRN